jgi:hypothetical protein
VVELVTRLTLNQKTPGSTPGPVTRQSAQGGHGGCKPPVSDTVGSIPTAGTEQTNEVNMCQNCQNELAALQNELIAKTVAMQEAKVEAYRILKEKELPIPPDLKAEVESV